VEKYPRYELDLEWKPTLVRGTLLLPLVREMYLAIAPVVYNEPRGPRMCYKFQTTNPNLADNATRNLGYEICSHTSEVSVWSFGYGSYRMARARVSNCHVMRNPRSTRTTFQAVRTKRPISASNCQIYSDLDWIDESTFTWHMTMKPGSPSGPSSAHTLKHDGLQNLRTQELQRTPAIVGRYAIENVFRRDNIAKAGHSS
jgi:hypothetical protein